MKFKECIDGGNRLCGGSDEHHFQVFIMWNCLKKMRQHESAEGMSNERLHRSIQLMDLSDRGHVKRECNSCSGRSSVRRRVKHQHLVAFFDKCMHIPVKVFRRRLEAVNNQHLFLRRIIPPIAVDGMPVEVEMQWFSLFKNRWRLWSRLPQRRTEQVEGAFRSPSFRQYRQHI